MDDLRGTPMSVGTLEEIIDDNHAIVSTSVGSEHYVSILSFVDKDLLEPGSQDVRQALGRPVLLRCSLLRGSPQRIASAVWRFKGQLLPPPPAVPVAAEAPDHSELRLDAVTRESSGSYECSVSNDVGSAACLFQVSGERPGGPAHLGPDPAHLQPRPHRPGAPPLPPTCTRFVHRV